CRRPRRSVGPHRKNRFRSVCHPCSAARSARLPSVRAFFRPLPVSTRLCYPSGVMGRRRTGRPRGRPRRGQEQRVGGIPIRAASAPAATPAVTPDVVAPNGVAHGRPGAQAMRVEHTLVELAQSGDRGGEGWRADPELATQVEEALARVPLRRRRVLLGVLDGLTQRQAVINAGYHVGSPQSASQMAQQILGDPAVQHAYQALLEARGLSGAKLDSIHALDLSRHSSPDGSARARSLRALAMARKYVVPRPSADAKPALDGILDEMSPAELEQFAVHGEWPARFAARLRALGFTRRD